MLQWVDGRPAAALPLADRGFAYGDGLFETLRVVAGQPCQYARHRLRLQQGCERLGIPLDLPRLDEEVRAFCTLLGQGVAKLVVTRGDGARGYAWPQPQQPRRVLLGGPLPVYPARHARDGIELFPCVTRLSEQPALAGLKHLNRLEQVLARAEWRDTRYAEGLLQTARGQVIEGVFSNLFLVLEGVLTTPDLRCCGVAGVMRAALLEHAQACAIPLRISDVPLERLYAAEEVFTCNSLYGVWPVRRLGAQRWPVGELTRTLQGFARTLLEA